MNNEEQAAFTEAMHIIAMQNHNYERMVEEKAADRKQRKEEKKADRILILVICCIFAVCWLVSKMYETHEAYDYPLSICNEAKASSETR